MTSHDAILALTLEGLEEDLEELRSQLPRHIEEFEGGLAQRVQELPVWLNLSSSKIRNLLRFPQDSAAHEALLGPRVVALAAGEIEQFVHTWIGRDGEVIRRGIDAPLPRAGAWRRDVTLLSSYLDSLEREAQAVSMAARTSLSHLRDEILGELESQRRQDSEALEALVASGDLDQGARARQELAALWEDQRRRAETFNLRWEQIERHIERGLDITESGLDTLRELLENANQGLSHAFPPTHSEELSVEEIHSATPHTPPTPLAADFDPYGDNAMAPLQDLTPPASVPLIPSPPPEELPQRHRATTPAARQVNASFFDATGQINDDLIFADEQQQRGPMIDFEEDEEGGRDRLASALFTSTPLPSPPSSTSPYNIFSSEDSESGAPSTDRLRQTPAAPRARQVASSPARQPEPTRMAAPVAAQTRSTPSAVSAAPGSLPGPIATPTPGSIATTSAAELALRVDDAQLPTAPLKVSALAAAAEVEEASTPTLQITSGQTEPLIDILEEHPLHEAEADELDIETLDLARGADTPPVVPASALTPSSDKVPRPTTRQAATVARVRQPERGEQEEEAEEAEELAARTTRAQTSWRGEAVRRRKELRPVGRLELALSLGLPVALIALLVLQGMLVSAPDVGWLRTHEWARGVAWSACAWLLLGPLFALRWRMGWRGATPTPLREMKLRDEAEVVLEGERLEVGSWTVARSAIEEWDRAQWSDATSGEQGWLLTLRTAGGEMWHLSAPLPQREEWGSDPLPERSGDLANRWELERGGLEAIVRWLEA